jgi:hypothetical protein
MATKYPPVTNIGSQIERAVLAYLQECYGDDAAKYEFLFSNDWKTRKPPYVEVIAHKSTETIPHTRNESFMVRIEWKWRGNNVAGETNPDVNWQSINDFVGVGMAGLSVSGGDAPDDLPATIAADIQAAAQALAADDPTHKDLATFLCDFVEYKGAQRAESDGQSFFIKEVRNFEIHAGNAPSE